jgi:hypothetical protein
MAVAPVYNGILYSSGVSTPISCDKSSESMILIQGHRAAEYADRTIDQCAQLLSESV